MLDRKLFVDCLKTSPRGSAPGPGGGSHEQLRCLLDDEHGLEELFEAPQSLARGDIPEAVDAAYMSARLTALQKPSGDIRGIATGTSFRRLVARTLARQFGPVVENA